MMDGIKDRNYKSTHVKDVATSRDNKCDKADVSKFELDLNQTFAKPFNLDSPKMLEWSVWIRCNEFELGGSFSVLIFVGRVPDDPKQWMSSSSCVGIHDVYTGSASHGSDGQEDTEVEGYVHLNGGLLERMGTSELMPAVVVPFLKRELHWRILNVSFYCSLSKMFFLILGFC
jgi:hypothetical protein